MAFTLKINGTPHEVDVDGDYRGPCGGLAACAVKIEESQTRQRGRGGTYRGVTRGPNSTANQISFVYPPTIARNSSPSPCAQAAESEDKSVGSTKRCRGVSLRGRCDVSWSG